MTTWRYVAAAGGAGRRGELEADSPADVRAALRRLGLRVLDVRPARGAARPCRQGGGAIERHLRRRRADARADVYDGLGTLLDAGLPLADAVGALAGTAAPGRGARAMLARLGADLRAGGSLPDAMRLQPAWFEPGEVAMVEAGQRGELAAVLRSLAARQERAGELAGRLVSALAYPCVVLIVGLGVVVFLSTRTLPQLLAILRQAHVRPPALTEALVAAGSRFAVWWPAIVLLGVLGAGAIAGLARAAERRAWEAPAGLRRLVPALARRVLLARLALGLAELVRTGVPLTESLRLMAPTMRGPLGASLRRRLDGAAARLERGDDLVAALDDPLWFDGEFRRLLAVGQTSGELPAMLERLGARYERSSRRAIDRLAVLLEPAVILVLAALVGTVVMAAVLPMLRLQEVVR